MKKLILTFTALVLLSSAALAFQGAGEPVDLFQSLYIKVTTVNGTDKVDDLSANMSEDHEVHIEEDSRHRVRRKTFHNRLLK